MTEKPKMVEHELERAIGTAGFIIDQKIGKPALLHR